MPRSELDLNPVSHITVDAIGQPGKRIFYLQGWREADPQPVTIIIEKVQLQNLALGIEEMLAEIANRRDLYSGAANINVPRALLWHPSAIPVSALRKFVHVRFVDRAELAALANRGSRARPEVRQMAMTYLASLSSS